MESLNCSSTTPRNTNPRIAPTISKMMITVRQAAKITKTGRHWKIAPITPTAAMMKVTPPQMTIKAAPPMILLLKRNEKALPVARSHAPTPTRAKPNRAKIALKMIKIHLRMVGQVDRGVLLMAGTFFFATLKVMVRLKQKKF